MAGKMQPAETYSGFGKSWRRPHTPLCSDALPAAPEGPATWPPTHATQSLPRPPMPGPPSRRSVRGALALPRFTGILGQSACSLVRWAHSQALWPPRRWEGSRTVPSGPGLLRAGGPQALQVLRGGGGEGLTVSSRGQFWAPAGGGTAGITEARHHLTPDCQGQNAWKSLQDSLSGGGN